MEKSKKIIGYVLGIILAGVFVYSLFWAKTTFTVTFDSNGGSNVQSQKIEIREYITKPVDPTREGYTFVGWNLNNAIHDFNTPVTKNMKLEAVWEEKVTTTTKKTTTKKTKAKKTTTTTKKKTTTTTKKK